MLMMRMDTLLASGCPLHLDGEAHDDIKPQRYRVLLEAGFPSWLGLEGLDKSTVVPKSLALLIEPAMHGTSGS